MSFLDKTAIGNHIAIVPTKREGALEKWHITRRIPVIGSRLKIGCSLSQEARMKYLRLYPYHIQLENVAFIEFLPLSGTKDRDDGPGLVTARIYFNGRSEPLEIKDPENLEILKRHFD